MDWYPFQWCPGRGHGPHADLVFWWQGVGIHIERKSRGHIPPTGPTFVHMFIFFCWRETININPYCECRQTLLPHFYSGYRYYLFRLGRTGFFYAGGIYWHTRIGLPLTFDLYELFWMAYPGHLFCKESFWLAYPGHLFCKESFWLAYPIFSTLLCKSYSDWLIYPAHLFCKRHSDWLTLDICSVKSHSDWLTPFFPLAL